MHVYIPHRHRQSTEKCTRKEEVKGGEGGDAAMEKWWLYMYVNLSILCSLPSSNTPPTHSLCMCSLGAQQELLRRGSGIDRNGDHRCGGQGRKGECGCHGRAHWRHRLCLYLNLTEGKGAREGGRERWRNEWRKGGKKGEREGGKFSRTCSVASLKWAIMKIQLKHLYS